MIKTNSVLLIFNVLSIVSSLPFFSKSKTTTSRSTGYAPKSSEELKTAVDECVKPVKARARATAITENFWANASSSTKREGLCEVGPKKMIVLADFDRTLTSNAHDGVPTYASHEVVELSGLLGREYHSAATAVRQKYRPISKNLELDDKTRLKACDDWYSQARGLFIEYGLTRTKMEKAIENAMKEKNIVLRAGADRLIRRLHELKIPLIIFSGGLSDVIEGFLKRQGLFLDNIAVIANRMRFDSNDLLMTFEKKTIHSMNKATQSIGVDYYGELAVRLAGRSFMILLGDSITDAHMDEGISGDSYLYWSSLVLKHGFLNDKVQEYLPRYQKEFDELTLNDGSFNSILDLLDDIEAAAATTAATQSQKKK